MTQEQPDHTLPELVPLTAALSAPAWPFAVALAHNLPERFKVWIQTRLIRVATAAGQPIEVGDIHTDLARVLHTIHDPDPAVQSLNEARMGRVLDHGDSAAVSEALRYMQTVHGLLASTDER